MSFQILQDPNPQLENTDIILIINDIIHDYKNNYKLLVLNLNSTMIALRSKLINLKYQEFFKI